MNRRAFLTALGLAPAVAKAVPAAQLQQTAFEVRVPATVGSWCIDAERRRNQALQQYALIHEYVWGVKARAFGLLADPPSTYINRDVIYDEFRDGSLEGFK